MMRISELRQKSGEELQKLAKDWQEKLRQLRFDLRAGKLKNVREVRETRKGIARIMTLLNKKIDK